jgi:hypothetical protein
MVKKSIAAVLLLAMVAWAEIAMAPMFIMHAWYMHPAREVAEHNATHSHTTHRDPMPAGHPCCPGLGKTGNAALLEFAASSVPCQDQHRCCFLPGPQSVPAPVTAGRGLSQEIAPAEIAELSPAQAESQVALTTAVAVSPPPGLLGMVIRI